MDKIDFVLLWVDGSDKEWLALKRQYQKSDIGASGDPEANGTCRYRDLGLLKYWFRAVERFAPWVNRVYFVTCGQKPDWLDESNPKLRLVNHKDYIPAEYLPTFQARTIELNLHRIADLSEQFVFFNDDMILLHPVEPGFFFKKGRPVIPCDLGIPNWLGYSNSSRIAINNCGVLKRNLDVNRLIWKNIGKYTDVGSLGFARAAKNLTCFAINRTYFPGTFGHLPSSHLKSTLDEIWRKNPALLDATSRCRFRSDTAINQWLSSAWNMVSGRFYPANEHRRGQHIMICRDNLAKICDIINRQSSPQICLSDHENTSDLERCFREISKAFDKLLPEKSSFEKKDSPVAGNARISCSNSYPSFPDNNNGLSFPPGKEADLSFDPNNRSTPNEKNGITQPPFFTVVISGYQTEPYLQKALDSIANQTFRDFEVICYVEESTDRSLEICRAMAERDPRFKVATGPKSGAVATTRNYGIDHASGKYLVVIDGDDWIVPDMLEKLVGKLEKTGEVDVLAFNAVSTTTDSVDWNQARPFSNFLQTGEEGVFSGLDAIRRSGRNGGSIHSFTWLNIYRVAFLRENHLYQTDGLLLEDYEWNPRVNFFAKRFAYLNQVLYIYRRRPDSLLGENSPRIVLDLARQFRSLASFVQNHAVPDDILSIWSNQWISVLFWFMFHPVSSRKITDEDRRNALNILFSGNGRERFLYHLSHASWQKRLTRPLVLLAAKGFQLPAKVFFRKLYYPLIERKEKT